VRNRSVNSAAFFARNACAELLASKWLAIRLESRGPVEDNRDGGWVLIIHADVQKAAVRATAYCALVPVTFAPVASRVVKQFLAIHRALGNSNRRRCAIIAAMEEPTPNEVFLSALDALLTAVAKSADDLHLFHDTVAKAPLAPIEPFPRPFVTLAERVIERLTQLDKDLEEVLVELGLTRTEPPTSSA
jgi:hypothetical protein